MVVFSPSTHTSQAVPLVALQVAVVPPFCPTHCRLRDHAVSLMSVYVPAVHPLPVLLPGCATYEYGCEAHAPFTGNTQNSDGVERSHVPSGMISQTHS